MTPTPPKSNNAVLILGGFIIIGIGVMIAFALVTNTNNSDDVTPLEPQLCNDIDLAIDDTGILDINPRCVLEDFTFTATTGEDFSRSNLEGELALVYFGYINCPDFCPPTMLDFQSIQELLGDDAEQVNFVFVTVDPERDTVEALDAYMNRFNESFIGLVGNDAELTRIASDYDLTYEAQPESAPGIYTVDHTVSRYLIDSNGQLIRRFSFALSPGSIANEIEAVLAG